MHTVVLGNIVKIKTGKLDANAKIEGGKYPFFTCARDISWIDKPTYDCECVLVAGNGDLNVKYYHGKFDAYQRTYIIESNNTSELSMKYLYYFMQSYLEKLRGQTIGGVIQYIKMKNLTDIQIPFPSFEEQRSIVAKLDKLTDLIELKKEAIGKTEELTKSVFLEMFGDPMINSKGWNQKELKYFGDIKTGNTPPRDNLENYGQFIEWIKSDNINNSSMIATRSTEFLSEGGSKVARIVPAGSILVTCIAGSPSCIGNCSIVNRSVTFNQQINAISPNTLINVYFLYFLFIIAKKVIQDASTNGMKGMVSKGVFEKIKFIAPPISLQDSFAQVVQKNQFIIENQNQSLQKLQELYNTTTQELFSF